MSSNKVKYNLKNVHIAKCTVTTDEVTGVSTYEYATPRALPGAVNLSLSAEGEASPFYADGIVYFKTEVNNGYSGDLELALVPDWFRQEILNETLDANGVLTEKADIKEATPFAMLFEFDGDKKQIRHVMHLCTVSTRPEVASQTKEDSISPITETLAITVDPRQDGLVKARSSDNTTNEVYTGWYDEVYIPNGTWVDTSPALTAVSFTSSGTLSPTFDKDITSYTLTYGSSASSFMVSNATVSPASATQAWTYDGNAWSSPKNDEQFVTDGKVVTCVVSYGGTSETYTFTISKSS